MTENLGKLLIFAGLGLVALGGIVLLAGRIPGLRLGRLPGDIVVEREGFGVYMPIATMLLLSLVFSLIVWIVGLVRR